MAEKIITELPCRIGDKVWAIRRFNGGVLRACEGVVSAMQYINSDMVLSITVENTCRGEWGKVVFVGEEQAGAKLTKKAVKDARWERAYKGTSFQKLADKYSVSKKTMQNAINGVTWKCVPYMPEPPKED